MKVQVVIDSELAWKVDVFGTPLVIPPAFATVGSLGKSLMKLSGFKVSFPVSNLKGRDFAGI